MNVRLLGTSAFLNVFTVFGLLLVLFIVTYFALRLLSARVHLDKYAKKNNLQLVFDFLLGSAFGAIAFAACFLQDYFIGGLPSVIVVNFVFIASWLFNYRFFLGAAIVTMGALIYNRSEAINDSEWITNMVFLAAVFLLISFVNIAKRKFSWVRTGPFLIFSVLFFHSVIVMVLYLAAPLRASADFYLVSVASSFIFALFSYWLALLVDRGLFGTRTLSSLARFDYANFVKQTFAREELHAFITKKQLTHGALISFFVAPGSEGDFEQVLYNAIKDRYANKDCLLISLASRYPSVYIPIRGNYALIKEIEGIVRALTSVAIVDLKTALGERASFKAFFSIYGVHADSAAGLMRLNLNYLLSPSALAKSRLISHSPERSLSVEKDAAAVERFLNSPEAANIEYFIRTAGIVNGIPLFSAELTSVPLLALNTEQCYQRMQPDLVAIAQRYYAMRVLRDFFNTHSEGIIIVYYSIDLFLKRGFSLRDFLNKLEAQGFDVSRIVFCLNVSPNEKPSVSYLRRLEELLAISKVKLKFAVRSNLPVLSPLPVTFLLKDNNQVVKNVLVGKRTAKVDYHKKV